MKRKVVVNSGDMFTAKNPLGFKPRAINELCRLYELDNTDKVGLIPRHDVKLVSYVETILNLPIREKWDYVTEYSELGIEEVEGEYTIIEDGILEKLVVKDEVDWK